MDTEAHERAGPWLDVSRKDFLRMGAGAAAGWWLLGCAPSADGAGAAAGSTTGAAAQAGTANATAAGGAAGTTGMETANAGPGLDTTRAGTSWAGDVVNLKYNNPFHQKVNVAWYEGKQVLHLFLGATAQKPGYKIAEQYLPLPKSAYKGGTPTPDEFTAMVKQLKGHGIFDSVPGDQNYSPIWHNNWVLVPDDYQPNTLKSVADAKRSGYQIVSTAIWVN